MNTKQYVEHFQPEGEHPSHHLLSHVDALLQKIGILEQTLIIHQKQQILNELRMSVTQLRQLKAMGIILSLCFSQLILRFSGFIDSFALSIFFTVAFAVFGWIAPELLLKDKVESKRFFIQQAIPDFLDQFHLLVSSPAYESFSQSLNHIAPTFPGYLGQELRELQKLQPFVSERELLLAFERVSHHPLITELITMIQVSRQFGSSLSEKTAQLIQTAQIEREHRIKDIGNKTSGLLLGPLLLFHLPALLIIFLIPFVFILQKGF